MFVFSCKAAGPPSSFEISMRIFALPAQTQLTRFGQRDSSFTEVNIIFKPEPSGLTLWPTFSMNAWFSLMTLCLGVVVGAKNIIKRMTTDADDFIFSNP